MKTIFFLFLNCCFLQLMAQQTVVSPGIKKYNTGNSIFRSAAPDSSFRSVKSLSLNAVYYNHLGFMCRQEVKMEKITKTSLRFRLGSVGYTDRMEGKLNAAAAVR